MSKRSNRVSPVKSTNRPDEWKIEQGLSGAKLPILDQTGRETVVIEPKQWEDKGTIDEVAIKAVGDRSKLFARERDGWIGYDVDFPVPSSRPVVFILEIDPIANKKFQIRGMGKLP
jgi:hypothetical protein